jgi:glycosyltransferase involved in cell wall biosynthesis
MKTEVDLPDLPPGALKGYAAISVIVPCFCCAETIDRAIKSIAGQTMRPAQVILVDDASPDNGRTDIALKRLRKEYEGRLNIQLVTLPKNGGAGAARNAGWERATQPYVAFLDADDAWHPQKLEMQFQWMEQYGDVVLLGNPVFELQTDSIPAGKLASVQARPVSKTAMLFSNKFFTSSIMLRNNVEHRFDNAKRYSEDYLLWLRIICGPGRAHCINLPLAYMFKPSFGSGGLSLNLWKMEKGELDVYRRLRNSGSISIGLCVLCSTFSLLKYLRRVLMTRIRRV